MYVKTLQQRKRRTFNKAVLISILKKAAVVLVIVGAGVLIGFTINKGDNKKEEVLSSMTPPVIHESADDTSHPPPSPSEINEIKEKIKQDQIFTEGEPLKTIVIPDINEEVKRPVVERLTGTERLKVEEPIINLNRNEPKPDEPSPGVAVNNRTGERTRKLRGENDATGNGNTRSENATLSSVPAKNISKFVSVKSNDYKRVAFGGIRDLQLTVTNESKYVLDNVTVELQYLKPSEEPLKTENIQFRAISPGSTMTIRIPDTNRGIKVQYRIKHILSTQGAMDTADL